MPRSDPAELGLHVGRYMAASTDTAVDLQLPATFRVTYTNEPALEEAFWFSWRTMVIVFAGAGSGRAGWDTAAAVGACIAAGATRRSAVPAAAL